MTDFFENLLSNGELQEEIAELKAENDRLKEEVETRDNLVEHFRKEAINWAKISNDCIKDIENYKQTLQEIRAIAQRAMAKQQEYKKDFEQILDLTTKGESEEE
jgi:hypothetical protein